VSCYFKGAVWLELSDTLRPIDIKKKIPKQKEEKGKGEREREINQTLRRQMMNKYFFGVVSTTRVYKKKGQ
jgi:hypothetical protein